MRMRSITLACLALTALSLAACGGVPFRMDAPPAFKRFEETKDFRFITADGVRLRGRLLENEPIADLGFWREAMKGHLEKRGFVFKDEQCFKTAAGLDGCTLDFVVPYGAEDWVQSETIFVQGDDLMLVEVVGPFDRYTTQKPALQAALRTFSPK
jgi:hypothetical protein